MGKTPKKAAPGGDERNLYVRRLKATTTSSSKGCDTSLTVKQRESDNSNRVKPIGVQKRLPVPVAKVFKPAATSKDEKKVPSTTTSKAQDTEITTMRPESEESAVQLKVSITKKDAKDGSGKNSTVEETTKEEEETCVSHSNSNGKEEVVEATGTENTTPRDENPKEINDDKSIEQSTIEEGPIEKRENGNESSETIKNEDEKVEETTERASFESETSSIKLIDEPEAQKLSDSNPENEEECTTNGQMEEIDEEIKKVTSEDHVVVVVNTQTTENCSVDVVESTTSEASDSGNVTQSDKEGEINDQAKESNVNDPSFVSYDSSIMLKDVQIKLNDCLKDNSKLFDVSNVDESNSLAEKEKRSDMSFGRTLRNISGRNTINRLRYVTVREHRISPNSSLFVNTSSASLDPEDSTSCKVTRYPTDLSDSIICNGSPAERKRKIRENATASAKKLKTDTSSLLNASFEMLKGIRKPVQVSTPNTKGYEFKSDRLGYKGINDDKLTIDAEAEPKKWCVVM